MGEGGDGALNVMVERTHADTDAPPTTDPTAMMDSGRTTHTLTLPNTDQIDSGPIMYVSPLQP